MNIRISKKLGSYSIITMVASVFLFLVITTANSNFKSPYEVVHPTASLSSTKANKMNTSSNNTFSKDPLPGFYSSLI